MNLTQNTLQYGTIEQCVCTKYAMCVLLLFIIIIMSSAYLISSRTRKQIEMKSLFQCVTLRPINWYISLPEPKYIDRLCVRLNFFIPFSLSSPFSSHFDFSMQCFGCMCYKHDGLWSRLPLPLLLLLLFSVYCSLAHGKCRSSVFNFVFECKKSR